MATTISISADSARTVLAVLEIQQAELAKQIHELRKGLSWQDTQTTKPAKKRTISIAARKRMQAAQQKRWADIRAQRKKAADAEQGSTASTKTIREAIGKGKTRRRAAA